jgi:L-fucose isomerase-like protein
MRDAKIKLGLVGAVHPNMPGDDEGMITKAAAALGILARELGFELLVHGQSLRSEADAEKARAFMDERGADFILLLNASLPYGRVILPLARAKGAIGLWSVPEPTTSGVLQLNSFCGTNMLGSIIANYLGQHDIPYKWFYGLPEDPRFRRRLEVTVRALQAVKVLKGARIAQIGGLADGFENLYVDERVLEKRFGTVVQSRHSVEEIVALAEALPRAEVAGEVARMKAEAPTGSGSLKAEQLEKSARIFLALRGFAADRGYDALALSCWSRFQAVYGIAVCGAMSRLNEEGTVTPCEADVTSAVTMLVLNALGGGKAALCDLVSFDESDRSLNLWHCGVAPASWAGEGGLHWDNHFNIGRYEGREWRGDGVVADLRFKSGGITVSNLRNDFRELFILTGESMGDKPSFSGSGGWVGSLRLNGEEIGLEDLMNTIIVGKVGHHYAAARGDLTDELNEFAAWTSLRVVEKIATKPYLQRYPF